MLTTVIIIRHGATDTGEFGDVFYGVSIPVGLSQTGKQQLETAGSQLLGLKIAAVYKSPLRRSDESVQALLQGLQPVYSVPIIMRVGLTDVAYPLLEGRPVMNGSSVLLANGSLVSLNAIEPYAKEKGYAAGIRSLLGAGIRFNRTIVNAALEFPGQTIVLVPHGDPIAFGLFLLQYPGKVITTAELIRRGMYLSKGTAALVQIETQPVPRVVRILYNPNLSELKL